MHRLIIHVVNSLYGQILAHFQDSNQFKPQNVTFSSFSKNDKYEISEDICVVCLSVNMGFSLEMGVLDKLNAGAHGT